LSEPDFAVYAQLREVRKRLAADEAVPVYAICTNRQLAEMAKNRVSTVADLKQIDGFGDAKTEKYGDPFLAAIKGFAESKGESTDEASGKSD
jgi:superfamily II DNA helicase RecQ